MTRTLADDDGPDGRLRLRRGHDRRLRAGHLWVYSNEVDTNATPLQGMRPGQTVQVEDAHGRWLGLAYVNPNSLICARLLSRVRKTRLDRALLVARIEVARTLRDRFFPAPYYRLLFGESDSLPGVVVDRYGAFLAVQITTAGMEAVRELLVDALDEVIRPTAIILRNDSLVREREGLTRYVELARGSLPERVAVEEGGCRFEVSLTEGQKTGWFYDQAANRDLFVRHVAGRRVLDVCSYVGAWSVRAVKAGAQAATAVDVSGAALEQAVHNAALNGVGDRVDFLQGDAFAVLRSLRAQRERFDIVVLDPPAFIKRKKDLKEGALAYRRLNEAALGVLGTDGLLVTASCSFHMHRDQLLLAVQQAARHGDRGLQLLQQGQQSPDHPVHPAIAETAYLKAFFLRVLPTL